MEVDWTELGRITLPGPSPGAPPTAVTTFAFDSLNELLWAGNDYGRVSSYHGLELRRYTSFRAHTSSSRLGAPGNAPVKQLLFNNEGVLSVSYRSVHYARRNGPAKWHIADSTMADLQCMAFTAKGTSEIVAAGCQPTMYRIDVVRGVIKEMRPSAVPFILMRRAGQHIYAAAKDGSVHLLDPTTLATVRSWKSYSGAVNDMDVRGDYLLTCGWTQQQYGGLGLERLVRVQDLRHQKSAAPIPTQSGAAFVRMHPKLTSTCIVLSPTGSISSIDVQNVDTPTLAFINTFDAQLTGLELMPCGKGLAFTDSHCNIILWGSPSAVGFNEFSQPIRFPDPPSAPPMYMDWSVHTPLNLIGMPYYTEPLLSNWSNDMVHETGAPPTRIDPALLSTLQPAELGLVGRFPRTSRRYEAFDTRSMMRAMNSIATPKFLSEQPKGATDGDGWRLDDVGEDAVAFYQPIEIKYSRFGVNDFDFGYFNKTQYSGLETHIVNSYANALLQLYRFTNVARNLALKHAACDCRYENCLLCELGFLVDMLEKARGQNCQATNFLKALTRQPGARQIPMLEDSSSHAPQTTMIQNLNRFLLTRLEWGYCQVISNPVEMQAAMATRSHIISHCVHCAYEDARENVSYTHQLCYPKPTKPGGRMHPVNFARLLQDSVHRHEQQRGWCMRCQGYKMIRSRRVVHSTPQVLMVHAAIQSTEARHLWSTPGFLPAEIGIINVNSQFYCYEGDDLNLHLQRRNQAMMLFELVGVVADVTVGEGQKSHLVALVNAALTRPNAQESDWHLINDFLARPVSADEALHFDARWKLPSVITYQLKSKAGVLDEEWKSHLDTGVLYRSLAQPEREDGSYEFRPLSGNEAPQPGMHCAIDAEFVRLLREEFDVGPDGSRIITRPARSGLARVSVLRGDGPDAGVPFIDDYIAVTDPIDDYLTQFSGLRPGDLTPGCSPFELVGLKDVYKKLWVLLNLGCCFIGHGLSSDFRTINMHVPDSQVIDTQELYSLGHRSQRKLSLRFLAWLLLGQDIQQNIADGHDSIEDARAALHLWHKWKSYSEEKLNEAKDKILAEGRKFEFKVPMTVTSPGSANGGIKISSPKGGVSLVNL
ncbi:hypothetical protein K470DRAFT_259573 [Piedraia hortae CBS 480.64]|uniref:PAN2-PAN3 deadenylation complex catalytic subunit PAN2 n=1 Tax=Piedraia hortae CBS 480.64 TaxID=1314780 RepID=A0A6A7BUM1_9PEZI|nr:hypothetical protein K470DRAFT_259573 [Piedraia hortae CBS 480.64]